MQTQMTSNDCTHNLRTNIICSISYIDSISSIRSICGRDFTGYADELSSDTKEQLLLRAIRCSGDSEVVVEMTSDLEDHEDAFLPLRGLDESNDDNLPEHVKMLMTNYFSVVGSNNATKALSQNIYNMADSLWGKNIIRDCDNHVDVAEIAYTLRENDESEFCSYFLGMSLDAATNKITRTISGNYFLQNNGRYSYDTPLPSNLDGYKYLREYSKLTDIHQHTFFQGDIFTNRKSKTGKAFS